MFSGVCWPALCAAFEKKKSMQLLGLKETYANCPLIHGTSITKILQNNNTASISSVQAKMLRLLPEGFLW